MDTLKQQTIAEKLTEWQKEQGWSSHEMARRVGVSQPTIYNLLTGKTGYPSLEVVQGIGGARGTSGAEVYAWLMDETLMPHDKALLLIKRGDRPFIEKVIGAMIRVLSPKDFITYLPSGYLSALIKLGINKMEDDARLSQSKCAVLGAIARDWFDKNPLEKTIPEISAKRFREIMNGVDEVGADEVEAIAAATGRSHDLLAQLLQECDCQIMELA
jgi:transcriptional regulator with XRE-family HTH domain